MSKVVLIINAESDLQYIRYILNQAWHNRTIDSPNTTVTEGPYLFELDELYNFKSDRDRPGVAIKMQLIDFIYNNLLSR